MTSAIPKTSTRTMRRTGSRDTRRGCPDADAVIAFIIYWCSGCAVYEPPGIGHDDRARPGDGRRLKLPGRCCRGRCVVDHASADHGEHGRDVLDLLCRNRQVIPVDHREVGEATSLNRPEIVLTEEQVGVV